MSSVTAILLTAGLSSRMKRCKLNLPFKNHTIIQEVMLQLSLSNVDKIVVVTGRYQSEIEMLVQENNKIELVHNPDYETGMTTSIKKGILATTADASGYMICLGDMPFIQTADYNSILNQFNKQGDQPTITRPFYQNTPGNPTVFSHHFKSDILKLDYMEGAKPLLKQFSDLVFQLDMETDAIIRDIDTREDYDWYM